MKTQAFRYPVFALVVALACSVAQASGADDTASESGQQTLEILNEGQPLEGVVSGGQPTEEALQRAAKLGFRTVVNLRMPQEEIPFDERSVVEGLGMEYVAMPIEGKAGLTEARVEELAALLDAPEKRPMLIHCASSNRVGALLALETLLTDGASFEEAMALGRKGGMTKMAPIVAELLRYHGAE